MKIKQINNLFIHYDENGLPNREYTVRIKRDNLNIALEEFSSLEAAEDYCREFVH